MSFQSAVERRLREYLEAVERHMAHAPAETRRDVLSALERQLHDALRARAPDPTVADLEAVLGDMDPPDSFSDESPDAAPPAQARRAPPGWAWFLLAVAFLAINGWAVFSRGKPAPRAAGEVRFEPAPPAIVAGRQPVTWTFHRIMIEQDQVGRALEFPPAALTPATPGVFAWETPQQLRFTPNEPWPAARRFEARLTDGLADADRAPWTGPRAFPFQSEPLTLRQARQNMLAAGRTLVLHLAFNTAPDPNALADHVRVEAPDGARLDWDRIGAMQGPDVYLRVMSVPHPHVRVRISKGLRPQTGEAPLPQDVDTIVALSEDLRFEGLHPEVPSFGRPSLRAAFNEHLDAAAAAGLIEIRPPVDFVATPYDYWRDRGLRLEGAFEPGQVYTVIFRAGLKSRQGYQLADTVERVTHFPDRPAALAIPADGRYLSPRGRLRVPFSAINLRGCTASLQPVAPPNIAAFILRETGLAHRYYGSSEADHATQLAGPPVTQTIPLTAPRNEEVQRSVDVRALAGAEPRGAYLLTLSASNAAPAHRLVVVTDLGLSARVGARGAWVWATHLRTAAPAAGVELSLLAENNEVIARARTDENGSAELVFAPDEPFRQPFLILAALNEDTTFLPLTEADETAFIEGGRPFAGDRPEAYLFTDRGIYRPGETVHIKALVRDGALDAPKQAFPVRCLVRRPDGRIVHEQTLMPDGQGAAECSVKMEDRWPTGRFSIEVTPPGDDQALGRSTVMLEEFVPPQIAVSLDGPSRRAAAAEKELALTVRARHLFGRPADGLPVSGRAWIEPVPFAPSDWKDWLFGDTEKAFSARGIELPPQRLDGDGIAQLVVALDSAWRPPATLRVRTSATVQEPGGRPVTAVADALVDAYPFYLGLRTDRDSALLRVGQDQRLDIAAVQPDGQLATEPRGLKITLARAEWISYLARDGEQYRWKSERRLVPVDEAVVSMKDGRASWTFRPQGSGGYVLTAADPLTGASSSFSFEAAEADQPWAAWSRERPEVVALSLDRPSYSPGETAKLLIKAPFAGTALLTLEQDRVMETVVAVMEGNTAEVDIPVRAEYLPNVHCHVTVIRPAVAESVWSAHRAAGSIPLPVNPPGRRLRVELAAAETTRPLSGLPVRVVVRDEQGQPAQGEVVLAAVDEGICMLTGFETPDPLKWFLAVRRASLAGYHMFRLLMPEVEEQAGGQGSHTAGDMADALMRRLSPMRANRFRPLALWASGLSLDRDGTARAEFQLPEFTGELRLMAVAYNARQAGSVQRSVLVRRPLAVQAGLPRFLAPGDACRAPVTVFNETGEAIEARIQFTCSGPLRVPKTAQVLSLPAGGQGVAEFDLEAGTLPGTGLVSVEVAGGRETYRETFELAVRPAAALTARVLAGTVAPGEEARLAAPEDWLPETVRASVRAGGRPEVRLAGGLDFLLRYPYGCLEQTVSACFPLLYLADLVNLTRPGTLGAEETDRYLQAGLLRVLDMQQADGRFGAWPRASASWSWGSLYAVHFLVEARRAGQAVPPDRIEAALAWVNKRLEDPPVGDAGPGAGAWLDDMAERAYACHVLALAGQPNPGWTERLREQNPRLSPGARAHLAAALLYSGRPRDARAVLESIGLDAPAPYRTRGGVLAGDTRDAALLLAAWLDADPNHPSAAALARRLDDAQEDGFWGATYDTALCLMALGRYARHAAAHRQDMTASLTVEGGPSTPFSDREPLAWDSPAGGAGRRLRLENRGPGPLYYTVVFEGVPVDDRVEEADIGLRVRREWLDAQEEPWPADRPARVGDLILVRITLETPADHADHVVVSELLPAGLELENPNLATSAVFPGLAQRTDAFLHRDQRDDRLLLFSGSFSGTVTNHYAARAVSAGRFVLPAIAAEAMYDPGQRSLHGRRVVEIQP